MILIKQKLSFLYKINERNPDPWDRQHCLMQLNAQAQKHMHTWMSSLPLSVGRCLKPITPSLHLLMGQVMGFRKVLSDDLDCH